MASSTIITEADILADVVAPELADLSRESAEASLRLRFREPARERMRELLERNNRGVLTAGEQQLLDNYLRVGQFLDLLQAKARLCLQDSPTDS